MLSICLNFHQGMLIIKNMYHEISLSEISLYEIMPKPTLSEISLNEIKPKLTFHYMY